MRIRFLVCVGVSGNNCAIMTSRNTCDALCCVPLIGDGIGTDSDDARNDVSHIAMINATTENYR
jgi:hypothetical protein